MKISEHNALIEKAKSRKDGVYSYNGYLYAVKNNSFLAYADYSGNISTVHGAFHHQSGKVERYDRRKALLKFLK